MEGVGDFRAPRAVVRWYCNVVYSRTGWRRGEREEEGKERRKEVYNQPIQRSRESDTPPLILDLPVFP